MLRAIKSCKFLSGWTNIIRTSQKRVASTAFSVQPTLKDNTPIIVKKKMRALNIAFRMNNLKNFVMRNNYISEKHFQMSLDFIKADSPNQAIISLIQCFGQVATYNQPEERLNYVQKVWDKLKTSGANLEVSYYNALLNVYIENEHKFSPTKILDEMKDNNIKPDGMTYRYLLSHFCREGDISGASSILKMMNDDSILYDEHIFRELILGYCIAKDTNGAENIMEVMKGKKFVIGSSIYSAYLCGLAMSGDLEKFNSVFNKCKKDGILRCEHVIDILYHLVINGQIPRACEIIRSYPDILEKHLHILLLRILNKKKYNECLHILSVLREKGFHDTLENTVWKYLVGNVPFESIKNLEYDLEKKGQNSDFLLNMLFYSLNERKFDKSLDIIRYLHGNGHLAKEIYFWPILIHALKEKSVDKILNILTIMRQEFRIKLSRILLVRVIFYNISDPLAEERLKCCLHSLGFSHSNIQEMHAFSCLLRSDIDKIYELSQYINPSKSISLIVDAITKKTKGQIPAKVVGLMRNLALSADVKRLADEVPGESTLDDDPEMISFSPQDTVDSFLKELVSNLPKSKHNFLKETLEEMVRCKLPVSKNVGEFIKTRITEPNVGDVVDELIDLPPLDVSDNLNNQNNKKSNSNHDIIAHFISLCKKNMIEEAEKIIEEHPSVLNRCSFQFMMALKRTNNEEKLNELMMTHARTIHENVKGTQNNIVLATELFRQGFIKEACLSLGNLEENRLGTRTIMEMLSPLLDKASTNDIPALLSTINENKNIISLPNIFYYYHDKRNFVKIIEILEKCNIEKVEALKLILNLIKPLAEEEQTELLKKVVSILEENFPRSSVVNELIFAYACIGDIEKARECLEKSTRKRYIFVATAVNINNDKIRVSVLENMLSIMSQQEMTPNRLLYERLIEDYEAMKMDPQKGLALWEQFQDVGLVESPIFLFYLVRLLKANNMPVPFDKSKIEDQEWLLNCNIPRPVLHQLLVKFYHNDANGVDAVIRQGIKNNLILPDTIKQMLHHIEEKEENMQMKNALECFLSLAEYKEAFSQGKLLQHAETLTQSSDPKIILNSIPHAFLADCLMTKTFDDLPSEIAQVIMWAHCHEILHDERLAHMYEAEVKDFIEQPAVVEGLLKFALYLKMKSRILKFLVSQGVFERFGLEKEAAFLSRYGIDGTRENYEQREREQSFKVGTESEGMSSMTENTEDGQVLDIDVMNDGTFYPKRNEEEIVAEEKSQAQAVPSSSGNN